MRLIDGDKLRETMYHEAFETDTDMQKWDSGCWIRYKMFENALENAPTVEAEPVKHGKWERIDPNDHNDYRCECSNCKSNWVMEDEIDEYSYCWVCGAKMDEMKGEEND